MHRHVISLLAISGLALTAASQSSSGWFLRPRISSEPLSGEISLCTDSIRGRVLAVTTTGYARPVEVSTWNGTRWNIRTTSLILQAGYSIAFDSNRDRVVLWGQELNQQAPAVYEWDGTNWQKFSTATRPQSNRGAAMAFDPIAKRTVLFGGDSTSGWNNETWGWDGSSWTRLATQAAAQPSARYGAGLAFDPVSKQILLHGGSSPDADTWLLGPRGWNLQSSPVNPPRNTVGFYKQHPMAADPTTGEILLVGSPYARPRTGWRWRDGKWHQFPLVQSLAYIVDLYGLAFDPTNKELVMFGRTRRTGASETWVYRSDWPAPSFDPIGAGCGTPRATLAPDASTQPYLGSVFTLNVANLPSAQFMGILSVGLSDQTIGSTPLPLDLGPFQMPGCRLYHSFDLVLPITLGNGSGNINLSLPADPSLRGTQLFVQAAAGRLATNAGRITLGLK